MSYEAIIGLEIHAELATKSKLFCTCENAFGGKPNSRICPVCTGQPGTLPSTNREAIRLAIRASLAFGCEISGISAQCRKHYFYPDLPKGYQISQRESPIGVNGRFEFISDGEVKTVGIHQIHIEEDAGKLVHFDSGETGVDYNRAGVPLIEIVTEPELSSAADARNFLEAVRMRLLRAGISDCKMEQGSLRCDVNVSLRRKGETVLNERVEMKNINTFSGAQRAIEYEIARQTKILDAGENVSAETRKWDDEKRESRHLRTKEKAIDYKFMPEPDIPCYEITERDIFVAGTDMPESDAERSRRYMTLGVSENDCECMMSDVELSSFFDRCCNETAEYADECSKLLVGDISAILSKNNITISSAALEPAELVAVAGFIKSGRINRQSAKKILKTLIEKGGSAESLARDYAAITDDSEVLQSILAVILENGKAVEDYLGGKEEALTYLTGRCMRRLRGRADAVKLKHILIKELKKEKLK